MRFPSANGIERPIRLSEATRRFALDSLGHKYGLLTRSDPGVDLTAEELADLTDLEKYDLAIKKIALEAPIRICPGELVSGAATLGAAIDHKVPAFCDGKMLFWSVSHLTVDFETVVKKGVGYIEEQAKAALQKYQGTEREAFCKSALNCLTAFRIYHKRYLEALKERPEYRSNYENLLHVPFSPAKNFYEGVQSIWFTFSFLRLCGNWPGIGRLDVLLGDLLENDLKEGKLTLDEAREILSHLFIKGCEWICGGDYGSGDAQHYQNIVLSGTDENGNDVTNSVTYLALDIVEETGISDFPITVRLNKNTDEKLLKRVAETMRMGGGIVAVYNEEVVLRSLTDYGYPRSEAAKFANDGCWEVQVPGKTNFSYHPFDSLAILQKETLKSYDGSVDFASFEELYSAYVKDLKAFLETLLKDRLNFKPSSPCTVVSLFEEGCLKKGLSYLEGGPIYNVYSPHIGGLADTVNFLYAVKKLVFDDALVSFRELIGILAANWEGYETLLAYAKTKYAYYGNDHDEVDELCVRLINDFADGCDALNNRSGYIFPGGVSTFGRQLQWSKHRLACAHGRKAGEVLAANASPTPGSDQVGATAVIRSYCKCDLKRLPTGAALDIRLLPSIVKGEEGLEALVSLLKGFVLLGGFFMQPDIVDATVLHEAQRDPENYQNLSVRVSGWNARFVTLNKEWQDMIISQNESGR